MPNLTRSQLSRYGIAGLSVLLATLLMLLLNPMLAMTQSPFLLFFGAVTVSAWSGGLGPGLVATALSGLISTYYFIPPLYSLSFNWSSGSRLGLFLLEGVLVSVLAGKLRAAKHRLERTLSKLRSSEGEYLRLATQSQEQAKTLRAIFSASVDHIYVFDQEGRYGYVSDGAAQVLGLSPDALLGKTWRDIGLPAALMEPVDAQRKQVISTGRSLKSETDFVTGNGVRSYEYILTPLSTASSTHAVVVISRDITDRKQAEAERKQSLLREQAARAEAEMQRNRLHSLLVQAPALICIDRGPEHVFEFANPLYSQLVGHRELIGLTAREAFPELEGQGFFELLDQVFETGQPFVGNEIAAQFDRQGNGTLEEGFFNFVYQPLFDVNGAVEGIVTFSFEVTTQVVARRQAEALAEDLRTQQIALKKSEARFSRLVEANIIGVLLAAPNGTILEANDAFLKIVGYTREDLKNGLMHWGEMTPLEYRQQDEQVLQELASTGSCAPFEKVYIRKDGSHVPILLGAAQLESDELAWVCFVLDLTESKQVEVLLRQQAEALAQANRLKDEFLATVSHELRTPLNAMLGWATMLREKQLDDATQQRAIETIERNARAQNQLINDLLDVSRIITGKLRLDVRPVALVSVLEAAIDSIRPAAEAKGIRLQSLLDPAAGPISGDPDRLQQVFWNLLSNAVKFTPKCGRIQLRLERINSHVEITVSDTGQGISPEFLPYVFDRLQQADSTTTRTHGGLGLGLAIVRHLVELHGGQVHVASAGEGKGTTFIVNLPITIFRPEPATSERVHPTVCDTAPFIDTPSLAGIKVLIVDDEADARELLATLLRRSGAVVTIVASAQEALATITQSSLEQRPDILVSDIGMPEVDGYTLMRQVRALTPEQGGRMPAIALTAYARTEDRIKALAAGFQSHVPKPVEPAEFIAVVVNLSERL
ncbi:MULTISPECIES: PAS domain S-box protein [Cyanophyceae]|uniref:hybrid sensor histidine kinase/response regulator n=1 Tax=Cyanophyceae TaxID=3028117 RepID=UPI001688F952|nr:MULTISPECIES: PAS domain S-box protein [Cyanophyceae]MBD1919470.1 PAS domain S-box protein [Phormidium sp. FACHB-77]MBD2054322.1 PAS domain S-box protein [Leptolyngbya sp. FACHB-60]